MTHVLSAQLSDNTEAEIVTQHLNSGQMPNIKAHRKQLLSLVLRV